MKTREEQKKDFEEMVELRKQMPGDKFCEKCNDQGYHGWDVADEYYIPCQCLLKLAHKIEIGNLTKEVSEN